MKNILLVILTLCAYSLSGQTSPIAPEFVQTDSIGSFNSNTDLELTAQGTGQVKIDGAYTLPSTDGTDGQVLTTDGAGAVIFETAGGGVSFGLVDQVPVTNSGTNDFDYSSSLTFDGTTLSTNIVDVSNTLEVGGVDYFEKASFTPSFEDQSSNVAGGTFDGYYARAGNTVTIAVRVFNMTTVGLNAGESLLCTNCLPFTPELTDNTQYSTTCRVIGFSVGSSEFIMARIPNASAIQFERYTGITTETAITVGDATSGSAIINFSMTYIID